MRRGVDEPPEYGFPADAKEIERMDLCHVKYCALLDKKCYLAPILEHPQRILELACGTGGFIAQPKYLLQLLIHRTIGAWSIDVADAHPSAEVCDHSPVQTIPGFSYILQVVGVDIAPIQPEWLPPNCRFEMLDIGAPAWPGSEGSFDFIFLRDPIMAIKDYPSLIDKVYK
jgi:hypothetical protein